MKTTAILLRRIVIATVLALTVLISNNVSVHAADASTLVVHYYRFDDDYDDWSLWIWPYAPESGSGKEYDFTTTDDYGVVATIDLAANDLDESTTLGIIVRDPNWVKDISFDRYVDLTSPNGSGEVHIYLVQGNPIIYYDEAEADTSDKILNATFIDEDTVSFSTTAAVTAADVTLLADDVEENTTAFAFNATTRKGSFDLTSAVDLTKKYVLEVDFGGTEPATASVTFDGFYASDLFNDQFGYDGELGAIYSPTATTFKLWAPISDAIKLNLYTKGHTASQTDYDGIAGVDDPYESHAMTRGAKGVWSVTVNGDLDGVYYTFTVENGINVHEIVDPYAFAAGINGKRGMVIDFDAYDPEGWVPNSRPDTMEHYTDAIIYELHVRDLTSHDTWNGPNDLRGKFLGLVEEGTSYSGVSTGFDHIRDLGVTHVQLIPIFDHGIIDETRLNDPSYRGIKDGIFNWGYMPENFNVLEGSYATDPYNGAVRTTEFKEMVQAFHENDIRVIMDVVYNHTGRSADSNFDIILPGYYFRMNPDGTFSNGSGTGNETASEHYMFRKYMVDSLVFWATEYNLDGFRFDLMKLHDIETMQAVTDALHDIDPTIMIFGEPWTGGTSLLPDSNATYNANLDQLPGVAVFNDDTRDGVKGSVFSAGDKGFVQGNNYADARILLGITGATGHPDLSTAALPKGAWAIEPTQAVNYVTAHDNNTLHDKLILSSNPTVADLIRMQRQSNAIILTSQGIPFLHAGVEILRTKPCTVIDGEAQGECDSAKRFDHNSYRSPDDTNQFDWNWKVDYLDTFEYYRALIDLRLAKDVFRLATADDVADHMVLINDSILGYVSFFLQDNTDYWKTTYIMHNNGDEAREITLHPGTWNVAFTTDEVGTRETITYNGEEILNFVPLETLEGGSKITLDRNETMILYSTESVTFDPDFMTDDTPEDEPRTGCFSAVGSGTVLAVLSILGGATLIILRKRTDA